jgi:putative CocE/NonD family hydrolase
MTTTRSRLVFSASTCALMLVTACGADTRDALDVADAIDDVEETADALAAKHGPARPDYTKAELQALAASEAVTKLNSPFEPAPEPSQSVYVTASDGTRLAVSLYFPAGFEPSTMRAPVVYVEGWYPRATVEAGGEAIELYRQSGFVVAIGDPRGFGASFGSQPGFLLERARLDQQEIIGWLTSQPWSDGRAATAGFSISATHAEAMAASGAPGLRAAVIRESDFDHYTNNLFPGGVPNLSMLDFVSFLMLWMHGDVCEDVSQCLMLPVDADTSFELLAQAFAEHAGDPHSDAFASLVYRDDLLGTGSVVAMSPVGHVEEMKRTALPARVSASWLDGTTAEGALRRFNALPGVPMAVFIGANTHSAGLDADPFSRTPFRAARPSAPEQYAADVRFLTRVLAGEQIGREVRYTVLGADTSKTTDVWPPRGVHMQTLELTRNGLRAQSPTRGERRYQVDPTTTPGAYNRWASQTGGPVFYGDRRFAPGRYLTFDAEPVERDTELVGAPELCLALRTDQTDGLVLAYLEDVAPNGRVTYLTEGELRLLHRKTKTGGCDPSAGTERTFARADGAPVTPGELMQLEIPLQPTAALIRNGHHLRISFAGADAGPRRQGDMPSAGTETFPILTETPATWSVAFGGSNGSRLSLPIRPWSRD